LWGCRQVLLNTGHLTHTPALTDGQSGEQYEVAGMALPRRGAARNDDEEDDAEEDGGDGGDPDQAAHRLLELLEREGDHEGEDDRQLSEHKAINLSCEGDSDAGFIEVVDWFFLLGLGILPAFGS